MHDTHLRTGADDLDDVDRLFARLTRAPVPDDLTARVLASTVARSKATRAVLAWPWMLAGLAALALLAIAGYQLGASLATGDGIELIQAIFGDVGLFATAPGDVLAALGEVLPLSLLALAAVSASLLVVASGHVVARVPASFRTHRPIA
jgi:hypothetical protein